MKASQSFFRLKYFYILINLFIMLLSGCGQKPETKPLLTNTNKTAKPTNLIGINNPIKATKPWKIAYILKTKSDPYWQSVAQGAQKAAREYGVEVNILASDKPPLPEFIEEQIILVNNLIKQEQIDGLIIGPSDSIRLVPVIEKAINQGIPVIVMDTPLNSDRILTFVGFNNFLAGELMGKWIVSQLQNQGQVLILDGPNNQENAIQRRQGFLAGLKTGNINIIDIESADWEQELAKKITSDWLTKYPQINAIIAANDRMALGAAEAVQNADRQNIIITGFDALETALQAVQNNKISATIDQVPALQAKWAVQLMILHLEKGETYPKILLWPRAEIITKTNVKNYFNQDSE